MAVLHIRGMQPVTQTGLADPDVLRDLRDRSLPTPGNSHDVITELLGMRSGHGAHPLSGAFRHHRSGVTYSCSRPTATPLPSARPTAQRQIPAGTSASLDIWTAVAYAIDTFLPLVDFKVADRWQAHGWLEAARVIAIAVGWLLGSLFITRLTRIIRT
ncbi:hypothetical protein GCM10027569_01430 [Flindersiella endophytica]